MVLAFGTSEGGPVRAGDALSALDAIEAGFAAPGADSGSRGGAAAVPQR